jgi:lysine N6-hydroxylase
MTEFDLVGIGVGPANLSLAALLDPLPEVRSAFLEAEPEFRWHRGLMLPESQLTVTYFRDLVTLVDPTNRYSFMNFLVQQGRAFRFLEANGLSCSRREFEQYYRWAAEHLQSIRWKRRVESVSVTDGRFLVSCGSGGTYRSKTLVLGSGSEPYLPEFVKPFEGNRVLHSSRMVTIDPDWKGRRVMVAGAGQSGAEVVNHLLADEHALPAHLTWISSGFGFQPLDDSPFTNEWFSPSYAEHFNRLSHERRADILRAQRSAGGDGITDALSVSIYRRLYYLDHVVESPMRHRLLSGRRAVGIEPDGSQFIVDLHDADRGAVERVPADLVILCTGYRNEIPEYLKPIRSRLREAEGQFQVRSDYSLDFDGPNDLRIYVQGFAESTHGLNDSLLSLGSWRSARIANSILGRDVYRTDPGVTTVAWQ